ncbi:winged helix-turn-helix domain-containing protein [Streptomyces sp. NPDC003300]|uniref:ArsR/SmtB family transcription factor n=1 Tax=unclassified Streptomyces TaxID=2593676 RepID=UPI0033B7818A
MGWWLVNADTLAGGRFVVSPLAETVASLLDLAGGTAAHPGESAWLRAHRSAYRRRLAEDPVAALIVGAGFRPTWIADFLIPPPRAEGEPSIEAELDRIRTTPADVARADLAISLGGPLPAWLPEAEVPRRAADVMRWVWTETVLPYWPRRRRVLEADIVARTRQLSQGGWTAALDDMRPGMRWLGEGRLQINAYDNPPREVSGARLLFVPVTPRRSWVSWDQPHRYAVIYPCAGVLAEPDRPSAPDALRALLGPGRAAVLVLLDSPKSTTQLVALTGQGLGSVGRHLKVLFDAGLIRRRRAGRSVLYYRTDAGEVLVRAQRHE